MKSKWKKLPVVLIGIIAIAVCGCSNDLQELNQKRSSAAKENTESTETVRTGTWETAAQTPYGAYPELVTYTLGQMSVRIIQIFRMEIPMTTMLTLVISEKY